MSMLDLKTTKLLFNKEALNMLKMPVVFKNYQVTIQLIKQIFLSQFTLKSSLEKIVLFLTWKIYLVSKSTKFIP